MKSYINKLHCFYGLLRRLHEKHIHNTQIGIKTIGCILRSKLKIIKDKQYDK